MTRKDYKLIAEGLGKSRPLAIRSEEFKEWQRIVWTVAEELERDNPNFDFDKFMTYAQNSLSLRLV